MGVRIDGCVGRCRPGYKDDWNDGGMEPWRAETMKD